MSEDRQRRATSADQCQYRNVREAERDREPRFVLPDSSPPGFIYYKTRDPAFARTSVQCKY